MQEKKMQGSDQRLQWQPPRRPEWVQRINEEGYCMDIVGVVPLDEKSLLESAMRSTGLSDFGTDDWREPFRILCKSFDEDAELNLIGRIRTRSEMLQLLEARLQIEETYKRHPEIDEEEIASPLFIIGQGRSGTSYLLNLLSANPGNGVLRTWESIFPCPPPEKATYQTDERIERAHKLIDQWNRVTPTMASMHEFAGNFPEDCNHILALSFRSEGWINALGQVAGYNRYNATADQVPAFRYHKRVLKLLQWKNPRKQWVLKDPTHLEKMRTILQVYPDACFVWPHRDPIRAVASTISLVGTMQWGRSDHPFHTASFDAFVDPVAAAGRLTSVIDLMERGALPKDRLHSLLYQDLVAKPIDTVEKIYKYFHLPLSKIGRQAMEEYVARNPRSARSPHKIDIGSAAEVGQSRKAFSRYQQYFGVPNEK